MFEDVKKQIIKYGMLMDRYNLIALAGGNLSARMPSGEILITPSGMIYEEMVESDVIVMDVDGNIIEGTRKPSSDTEGILYVFKNKPDVNAVIHTHQPYATAIGLIREGFWKVNLTTLGNVVCGHVPIAPYSSPGSIEMGMDAVKYLGDAKAVILEHHGILAVGADLKHALNTCVYMEEAAKCYLAAEAVQPTKPMTEPQVQQCAEIYKYVGQEHGAIPRELLTRR